MLRTATERCILVGLLSVWILTAGCASGDKRHKTDGFWSRHEPEAAGDPERIEADPAQRRINIQLASARSLEMDGTLDRAAEIYRGILADAPQHPVAAHRLALIYSRQGRFADAEPLYQACLQQDPTNADLHCDLGYAHYLQGRWSEAEQGFRRALELNPGLRRAHTNLGLVCARAGRTDEAFSEFALAGCTAAEAKANVAFAALLAEDWPRAAAFYQEALGAQPDLNKAAAGLQTVQKIQAHQAQRLAAGPPQPAEAAISDSDVPRSLPPIPAAHQVSDRPAATTTIR